MFVRVKTTPNSPRKSVQIVASERKAGKVRQRIIRHVGIAMDDEELERLKDLGEYIKAKLETESLPTLFEPEKLAELSIASRKAAESAKEKELQVDLRQLREDARIVVGIHDVYGQLYNELGFDRSVGDPNRRRQAAQIIRHLVMARIANPASKRGSVINLERDFGVKINLASVYRSLDFLNHKQINYIQNKAWEGAFGLFQGKIDVIFYDCTTLYFETTEEDDLRDKGYSKDMKFNQSQVLLALMVTKEGIPVGYRLYRGSTFEGNTLMDAISHLKKNEQVDNVVFVADGGLFSEANLRLMEAEKNKPCRYIVGARLKKQKKEILEQVLDINHYIEKNGLKYKEIQLGNGRRLLVNYSEQRAKKDAYDRQLSIDKLLNKLKKSKSPESFISNFGYRKFLKIDNGGSVSINQCKIEEAKQWDGLHGVITNLEDAAEEVFAHYKGLWQVEESFRITKHDLKTRPIFHWTPKRIQAHIAVCFMALTCTRHLMYRVKLRHKAMSAEMIRNELVHTQLSILKHQTTKRCYGVPSKSSPDAQRIYETVGLKLSTVPFAIK